MTAPSLLAPPGKPCYNSQKRKEVPGAMSEFSHLKHKLLAEQVEDRIYHYIPDTP